MIADVRQGHVQTLCDLPGRQPLPEFQPQNFPLLLGKLRDDGMDALAQFAVDRAGVGPGALQPGLHHGRCFMPSFHPGLLASQVVADVSRDLEKPRKQRLHPAQPLTFAKQSQKGLLHCVLRQPGVAEEDHRVTEQGDLVGGEELGDRCANDLSTVMMRQGDEAQMHIYYQQLFTLLPLAMAFFHFTLFLFFPQFRENLFYAVCLTGYAGLVYYYELMGTETDIYQIFYYAKLAGASNFVSQVFGLLTMYTILKPESLNRIRVFFAVGVVLLLTGMYFSGEPFNYFTFGFLLITVSELIYISVTTTIRDKNARIIMVSGITVLIFFIAWQLLIDFGWFEHPGGYYLLVNYGFLGLMLSMTTYLSYEFAKTNKDLSQRIQTIELLTEEKISKEREALQAETERKLIAAEYERKSAELEDARKLQISMLPKSLPQIDCYTARVRMETAAEVGGDYYDIRQYTKHDNFVIVGDATGHGAKAGIMVTITKSLLAVLDLRKGLAETIIQLNKSIKLIGLHSLYMSLLAAELGERGIRYISAGMPPVFVYRKKERTTETVISKSMPLGAFADFQYSIQNIDLDEGDCVIFVTDGLTELFNKQQEIFGIERTAEVINTILAANPTEQFLDRLFEEIKRWGNGQLNDDITVMILEYKGKN